MPSTTNYRGFSFIRPLTVKAIATGDNAKLRHVGSVARSLARYSSFGPAVIGPGLLGLLVVGGVLRRFKIGQGVEGLGVAGDLRVSVPAQRQHGAAVPCEVLLLDLIVLGGLPGARVQGVGRPAPGRHDSELGRVNDVQNGGFDVSGPPRR